VKSIGSNVVRIEAEALRELADRIAGPMASDFDQAVECLQSCGGRVVVTGMGKSGIIARKIAATLSSTGTPALFLHPAEALHGDLGMVAKGDTVVALSSSGETEEILQLLATVRRIGSKLITITGDRLYPPGSNGKPSTLAQAADIALDCSIARKLVRWVWLLQLLQQQCSRWEMLWPSRWPRNGDSRKRILRTCIPAGSWAKSWRASPS